MGVHLPQVSLAPTSFDVSDGVQTFTDPSSGLGAEIFSFWTDSLVAIAHWHLAVGASLSTDFIQTLNLSGEVLDFSRLDTGTVGMGFNEYSSGTWPIPTATELPEPASMPLVVFALLAAAAVGHRSGRRRAAGAWWAAGSPFRGALKPIHWASSSPASG